MARATNVKTTSEFTQNLVAIKDLPLYPNPSFRVTDNYKFIDEEPLPFQKECRLVRLKLCETYKNFVSRFERIDNTVTSVRKKLVDVQHYLQTDEASNLPKAAAITVGGLAGFVMSLRRHGAFRKVLYPAFGLAVTAAFCYPVETIDVVQIGIAHAQRTWENFKQSPQPDGKANK